MRKFTARQINIIRKMYDQGICYRLIKDRLFYVNLSSSEIHRIGNRILYRDILEYERSTFNPD